MARYIEVLLEGGSRSGKTFISMFAIIIRCAKYEKSHHLVVRRHFTNLKSIWYETLPAVLRITFPEVKFKKNKQDWYIEFTNGSTIWFAGIEDKERMDKILGREWCTIFMNEASELSFEMYDMLKSRLNPLKNVKPLLLIDYNPPSKRHWGYLIFHKGVDPDTGEKLSQPDRYAKLQMNPTDNLDNLNETYIDTLNSMGEKRRNRFLHGLYGDDSEDALWKREWVIKNRVNESPERLDRVVVGIDPAVTGNENSDSTGIAVVASAQLEGKTHYYVLDDMTIHGDVTGWGQEAVKAYKQYMADCIVGEVNQGGDLVEMNVRNYDRNIRFKSVRATRGKAVRAEPIADLYERGFVHHVGTFPELEDQQCTWSPKADYSPDNLDALVWALTHLSGVGSGEYRVLY